MAGFKGKVLEVNLTTGAIGQSIVERDLIRKFIGGSGLAAKLFFDRVSPNVDPLSGENILFVMTGPVTGSNLPGSARFSICAKSPLTNIWGEACCGGNFGPELRFAGYEGIAIKGISQKPVYLLIDDDRVEICDASHLWGKDTYEVTDLLKKEIAGTRKVKVLSIGQAGENLVKYANIMNDKADAAGRCGLGAVMGSKKLKAIVARGTGKVEPAMPEGYAKRRKEILEKVKGGIMTRVFRAVGTNSSTGPGARSGDLPSKNWSLGENLAVLGTIDGQTMSEKYLTRTRSCYSCPIGSKRVVKVTEGPYKMKEGPGPEYETIAAFGSMLLIHDLPAIFRMNETCNRHGLDTISCGSTIAFAMDCFDNGLIGKKDTDGIELKWGEPGGVLKMVDKIARRDGFGDILAEGSKRAAEKIGKNAADYTAEVKGLEVPMHDPRAGHGLGLAYATSIRGACHLQHGNLYAELNILLRPEIGMAGPYPGKASEGKAEMTVISENLGMVVNAAVICWFAILSLSIEDLLYALRATSGFDYDLKEMMECGERVWMLKRGLDNLMGITAADDRLPKRIMTATTEGGAAGFVPDMELMLKEYYRLRPLDASGRPTKEKLQSLGLSELAAKL